MLFLEDKGQKKKRDEKFFTIIDEDGQSQSQRQDQDQKEGQKQRRGASRVCRIQL